MFRITGGSSLHAAVSWATDPLVYFFFVFLLLFPRTLIFLLESLRQNQGCASTTPRGSKSPQVPAVARIRVPCASCSTYRASTRAAPRVAVSSSLRHGASLVLWWRRVRNAVRQALLQLPAPGQDPGVPADLLGSPWELHLRQGRTEQPQQVLLNLVSAPPMQTGTRAIGLPSPPMRPAAPRLIARVDLSESQNLWGSDLSSDGPVGGLHLPQSLRLVSVRKRPSRVRLVAYLAAAVVSLGKFVGGPRNACSTPAPREPSRPHDDNPAVQQAPRLTYPERRKEPPQTSAPCNEWRDPPSPELHPVARQRGLASETRCADRRGPTVRWRTPRLPRSARRWTPFSRR
jgi:hypothetical protein